MKEVPKKDLPEVSGGDFHEGGCIPYPRLPGVIGPDDVQEYPQTPVAPVLDRTFQIEA